VSNTVERCVVTVRKVPPEERDVFRAPPEDRQRSYQEVHPGEVGQQVSYSMDLAEEDIEWVRRAGNLIDLLRISDFGTGYRPHDDPQDQDYPAAVALQDLPGKAALASLWPPLPCPLPLLRHPLRDDHVSRTYAPFFPALFLTTTATWVCCAKATTGLSAA
jgi:hypothetical protein